MRGGPFAEKRVIELINLRFVPTFFNVGKGAPAYDADTAAFIAKVDSRFAGNRVPTPPVWVFSPDQKLLATIDNYTHKDLFYEKLLTVLKENPAFAQPSLKEKKVFKAGKKKRAKPEKAYRAARLYEQLGEYKKAVAIFKRLTKKENEEGDLAQLALTRVSRYSKDWEGVAKATAKLEKRGSKDLRDDVAMERAYLLLEKKKYKEARKVLVDAIHAQPQSERMGEMHYWAGVACFHLKDRPWANFHWCWVLANIEDDYNYMRCYLAASTDAIPWANPDLGGHRSKNRMVSHALADAARDKAMADYKRLAGEFKKP